MCDTIPNTKFQDSYEHLQFLSAWYYSTMAMQIHHSRDTILFCGILQHDNPFIHKTISMLL